MPANPRTDQIVSTVAGTDLFPVSLRGSSDRDDKTAGYIDRTWYISAEDLAEAVVAAVAGSDGFGDLVDAIVAGIIASGDFSDLTDAIVAALDNYEEPTWTVV